MESELCARRRASCEFARGLKKYCHALIDGRGVEEEVISRLGGNKMPKKLTSGLQHTLKTLHAALEVSPNSSFIADCFAIDANKTVFVWYYDEESVPGSLTFERTPKCLMTVTSASYYPFDVTVNQNEFRLHAVFNSQSTIYSDGDVWKEWDGHSTLEVPSDKACKIVGLKALSYVCIMHM